MPSWVPTSPRHLEEAERSVLKCEAVTLSPSVTHTPPGVNVTRLANVLHYHALWMLYTVQIVVV